MSTKLRVKQLSKVSGALFTCLWLVACTVAWERSTSSGGNYSAEATGIATETAKVSRLSRKCTQLAENLADASIKERVTRTRPTNRIMKKAEQEAAVVWDDEGCPDRALPLIAYGVSKIALQNKIARESNR